MGRPKMGCGVNVSGFQARGLAHDRWLHSPFLHQAFPVIDFRFIIRRMSKTNPLGGIVPNPTNNGETTITEHIEKVEGEVALDAYVRAQTSAPEVVKRITELENCLQRLANAVFALTSIDSHPELRAAAEEAKLVLKNRLEVDDAKHRFHSELGVFGDELRIIKD
jgi:hypothetical protein